MTSLVVRRGLGLERIASWGKAETRDTVERIREHLEAKGIKPKRFGKYPGAGEFGVPSRVKRHHQEKRWRPGEGDVVVDTVGLDRLDELNYETSGFNGGKSPRDGKKFLNARAEAYWELRDRLEAGEIALPRDEKFFEELVAIRWSPNAVGRVQIESKDPLKARRGRTPDRADALVMSFYSRSVRGRGLRRLEALKMG